MLALCGSGFQICFDGMDAYSIIKQFKSMFQKHVRLERFEANCRILECKLVKRKLVGPHVFNLIGHFHHMAKLGFSYLQELAIDIIINSLTIAYKNFHLNLYLYMQGGNCYERVAWCVSSYRKEHAK